MIQTVKYIVLRQISHLRIFIRVSGLALLSILHIVTVNSEVSVGNNGQPRSIRHKKPFLKKSISRRHPEEQCLLTRDTRTEVSFRGNPPICETFHEKGWSRIAKKDQSHNHI